MASLGAPGPFQDDQSTGVWPKWTTLSQQIFLRPRCPRPLRALFLTVASCALFFFWLVPPAGEVS